MPDTEISNLTSATAIDGTELVPIVKSGANRKVTPQLLQTQVYTERTLDFQIALTDRNRDQHINSASPVVCTIPLNATVAFDVGDRMDFVRLGAGTATIDAVSGVTLNGVDGDSIAIDAQYVWVRLKKVGADAWQCSLVEGRTYTPATHGTSHQSGGSDPIKLDDLATPDDNTDLNATTARHGLLPKLSGVSTEFLNGNGAFSTPAGGSPGGSANELQRNNSGSFGGATGVTWASNQLLITAQAAATVPFAIDAAASQTAAMTTWSNSAGTVLAEIRSSGKIVAPQAGFGFAAAGYGTNTGGMDYSGGVVRFLDGQNVVMVAFQPGFAHQRGIFCSYKLKLANYTVATLPSAVDTAATGCLIFVTDESGGAVPAFSDGTDWRRVTDRAIVS